MTHPNNLGRLNTVLQLLTNHGTSSLAEGLCLLLNEAMLQERSAVLRHSHAAVHRQRRSHRICYRTPCGLSLNSNSLKSLPHHGGADESGGTGNKDSRGESDFS